MLQGPSLAHFLGTDELGRDILSRLVTAAAPTIFIAFIVPDRGRRGHRADHALGLAQPAGRGRR